MHANGFTKLPNSLWAAPVSPEAKLTYAAIASFAYGEKTTAWPSQATLARKTGYSERSIRRFTAELDAAGLVRIERRRGRASVYTVIAPVGQAGVEASAGLSDHLPRPQSPPPPDGESAEEDQRNTTNESVFSPDSGSGVEGQERALPVRRGGLEVVEGDKKNIGHDGVTFDASDVESWKLVPDHLKISVPGVVVFDAKGIPRCNGVPRSPSEYWRLWDHDFRRRVAEAHPTRRAMA